MIFLHASLRGPRPPNGKRGTIFRRALNSKNDMTGASRKIWILIYPHPSDAREPQKDTPFPFFLFRRQRVSKGNFIFNRENIVRIRSTFLAERNASGLCYHSAAFRLRRKRPGRRTRPGRDGCVSDAFYGLLRSGRASRSKALSSCSGAGAWAEAASAFR